MIDELVPVNDNFPMPPYKFKWLEMFLIVSCCALASFVACQAIGAILEMVATWTGLKI